MLFFLLLVPTNDMIQQIPENRHPGTRSQVPGAGLEGLGCHEGIL